MLQPAAAVATASGNDGVLAELTGSAVVPKAAGPALAEAAASAAADEPIPEALRPELEAAAHERLEAEGVPEFLRIRPMVRDVMVRLWLGEAVPVLATG